MTSTFKSNAAHAVSSALLLVALMVAASSSAPRAFAQAANKFLGTVTAINGTSLTVKTDAGEVHTVDVPAAAAVKRVAPGEKDLSTAETIQLTDLATGDRVLVRLDPDAQGANPQALQIVTIKAADVAAKQQKDREDWQRRGVGGLVKSVDAGSGVIVVTSGIGATAKSITVHTTPSTVLKRYAPASVRFDTAVLAPIDQIHPGDQLRARGTKSADGLQINAEELVSGTFRNLSGKISSIDAAASTFVIKDLATKKQVTIQITPDAQMRRLPEMMARMMAARLKGGSGAPGGGSGGGWSGGQQGGGGGFSGGQSGGGNGGSGGQHSGGWTGSAGGNSTQQTGGGPGSGSGWPGGGGQGAGGFPGGGGGDPQQMLNRAPAIQFADLKKDDAVMIVSTDGATDVTAITLLAGVEPLLEAPAASQNLLSNWSMGSGGAEAAAQ